MRLQLLGALPTLLSAHRLKAKVADETEADEALQRMVNAYVCQQSARG